MEKKTEEKREIKIKYKMIMETIIAIEVIVITAVILYAAFN